MTISELVRKQILLEGSQIEPPDGCSQAMHIELCENYVDEQLNAMTNVELLERISTALESSPQKERLCEHSPTQGVGGIWECFKCGADLSS